jgi:SAM-dependent methyltransferase
VDRIVAASPGADVLDVGIGTGIAARLFQSVGCRVLGIDVDERMADLARRNGFEVDVARFEDWDAAGRTFDAVVAGQSWHWVDPLAGAVKARDVLRPGGRLALFWNVFQPPPEIARSFAAVYGRVLTDERGHVWARPALEAYSRVFTNAADGIRQAGAFGDPEQWRFDWERSYTRSEWLDQVPTHGGHGQLPSAQHEELLAGIGAAIDAAGGSFTMGYAAVAITAARSDPT